MDTMTAPVTKPQCVGTTKKGNRCKRLLSPDSTSPFCDAHEYRGLAECVGGPLDGWFVKSRARGVAVGRTTPGGYPVLLSSGASYHGGQIFGVYEFEYEGSNHTPLFKWHVEEQVA